MRTTVVAMICAATTSAGAARADDAAWFGDSVAGTDKALHFGGSAALAVIGYGAATGVFVEPWQRALCGAGIAAAAGLAKEGVDLLGLGTPSVVDLAYDAAGIAVGVGYALALDVVTGDDAE